MKFQLATSLLALSSVVSATVMHVVTVGKDGKLAFCPEQITAASGDLVQFQFYPKVFSSTSSRLTCSEPLCCSRFLRQRLHTHFRSPRCHSPKRYLTMYNRTNIQAHSPVSCPLMPAQIQPPFQPSQSPSTAQVQNGSTALKPNIVKWEWCSPLTQPNKRLSPAIKQTAPTQRPMKLPTQTPRNPLQLQLQLQLPHLHRFLLNQVAQHLKLLFRSRLEV